LHVREIENAHTVECFAHVVSPSEHLTLLFRSSVFNTVCDISNRRKRFHSRKQNPVLMREAFTDKASRPNNELSGGFTKGKPRSISLLEHL